MVEDQDRFEPQGEQFTDEENEPEEHTAQSIPQRREGEEGLPFGDDLEYGVEGETTDPREYPSIVGTEFLHFHQLPDEPDLMLTEDQGGSAAPKEWDQHSDEDISKEVCERLTWHGRLDSSQIEVEVKQGVVTLQGSVDTEEAKNQATEITQTVPGVKEIHSELKVTSE